MPACSQPARSNATINRLALCLLAALVACDTADDEARTSTDDVVADSVAADLVDDAGGADSDTADVDPAADTSLSDGAGDILQDAEVVADTEDTADTEVTADTNAPPPAILITVNEIPREMNGTFDYPGPDGTSLGYTLRVNRANFTLDVMSEPSGGPLDWDTLDVVCDDGVEQLPLGPFVAGADPGWRSVEFDEGNALADGLVIGCTAVAQGPGGSAMDTLSFTTATLAAHLDPFPLVDQWLVVLSRDIQHVEYSELPDQTIALASTYVAEGNGIADFEEPFLVTGLFSQQAPEAMAIIRDHLLRRVRAEANRVFGLQDDGSPSADGVRLRLWFEGDDGAPTPADFAGGELSMIALGGDGTPADQAQGTFGRALIDWNNQGHEDDTVYGLGVFTAGVVRALLQNPLGVLLLQDILPSRGGTPFGLGPDDTLFIGQDLDPATLPTLDLRERYDLYTLLIDVGSLALAAVLCHEMGHSLGLVPFGAPPEGLFAGVSMLDFTPSFAPDAHINTEGLNIMQTGGSVDWVSAFNTAPSFNPLNWAYLRRQLVVGTLHD